GMLPRRIAVWWMVAAIGQWFGNGALFVTPACAIVLCVERWRRAGLRPASWTALAGAPWLVSFALNYALVLRHALANTYLKNCWAVAFPELAEGAGATVASLVSQFGEFALKPGGRSLSAVFWLAVAIGIVFALATRRPLGLMVAAVPISAVALAVFPVVPIFERLALWNCSRNLSRYRPLRRRGVVVRRTRASAGPGGGAASGPGHRRHRGVGGGQHRSAGRWSARGATTKQLRPRRSQQRALASAGASAGRRHPDDSLWTGGPLVVRGSRHLERRRWRPAPGWKPDLRNWTCAAGAGVQRLPAPTEEWCHGARN